MGGRRWRLGAALLATGLWLWFIYARSAKTAELSDQESGVLLELLVKIFPFLTMHLIRKLAHFTEYLILGALLYLDWRLIGRGPLLLVPGLGLLAAAADEYLQTFVPGRSGEMKDVLLDCSGVLTAVCLALLLRRGKEKRNHGS